MKNTEVVNIGKFEIESGVIRISDPCYDKETWCAGTVNGKKGTWNAFVKLSDEDDWGERVVELVTYHSDNNNIPNIDELEWEQTEIDGGVDSGQLGIFDDKYYQDESIVTDELLEYNSEMYLPGSEFLGIKNKFIIRKSKSFLSEERMKKDNERWYSMCCGKTLGVLTEPGEYEEDDMMIETYQSGVVPFGCVSRSGYGDGGYPVYIMKYNDEIIGIKVVFISDEDEESED